MSNEKSIIKIDPDLEELIPGFLENRVKDVASLQEALTDENYQTMQSIGHSLKGVGGGYGFDGMSELGAGIEAAAKQQDISDLSELIKKLDQYMQNIEIVFEE